MTIETQRNGENLRVIVSGRLDTITAPQPENILRNAREGVADPIHGFSDHSRGNTVDVTIIDKGEAELTMPTEFDSFSQKADRDYRDVPDKEAIVNAWMLQETMTTAGFTPYVDEWWRFSDTVSYEPEKNFTPKT